MSMFDRFVDILLILLVLGIFIMIGYAFITNAQETTLTSKLITREQFDKLNTSEQLTYKYLKTTSTKSLTTKEDIAIILEKLDKLYYQCLKK